MRNYVNAGVSSTRARLDAAIRAVAPDSRNDHALAHLRVLMVTQSYYPFLERGGSAATVQALAQGLAQRGHSVTVLTSDLGISTQPMPVPAAAKTTEGWRYDHDGVETIYLSSRGSYRALTWNPGIFAFCANRLSSFDIVHIYGTYDLLGPAVARACRRHESRMSLSRWGCSGRSFAMLCSNPFIGSFSENPSPVARPS